jgi:hypothetical protein
MELWLRPLSRYPNGTFAVKQTEEKRESYTFSRLLMQQSTHTAKWRMLLSILVILELNTVYLPGCYYNRFPTFAKENWALNKRICSLEVVWSWEAKLVLFWTDQITSFNDNNKCKRDQLLTFEDTLAQPNCVYLEINKTPWKYRSSMNLTIRVATTPKDEIPNRITSRSMEYGSR